MKKGKKKTLKVVYDSYKQCFHSRFFNVQYSILVVMVVVAGINGLVEVGKEKQEKEKHQQLPGALEESFQE